MLKERHEKITKVMIDRIQPYVDGHMDEFEKSVDSEARRLSTAGKPFPFFFYTASVMQLSYIVCILLGL